MISKRIPARNQLEGDAREVLPQALLSDAVAVRKPKQRS
jgi:hypothetical protein